MLAFASVLFASGLAGHAAADGAMPGTSVLVALFVFTVVLAAPFAVAPVSLARAVALRGLIREVGARKFLPVRLDELAGSRILKSQLYQGPPPTGNIRRDRSDVGNSCFSGGLPACSASRPGGSDHSTAMGITAKYNG